MAQNQRWFIPSGSSVMDANAIGLVESGYPTHRLRVIFEALARAKQYTGGARCAADRCEDVAEKISSEGGDPQAVVLMMPPSAFKPLVEFVELPLRFASSLLTNEEMIDCGELALVEDVDPEDDEVPDAADDVPAPDEDADAVVPVAAEVGAVAVLPAVRLFSKF